MKLLLFIIFLISGAASAEDYSHLKSEKYWKDTPTVYVCQDSNIDLEIVSRAIKYWADAGYEINPTPKRKSCALPSAYGQIVIDNFRDGNPRNVNGTSKLRNYEGYKYFTRVDIKIKKSLSKEVEIFKHELGHAVGLNDEHNDPRSIMVHKKVYD